MGWSEWLTANYMPRGECGIWPAWLLALAQASDTMVAFSYFWIPLSIWRFQAFQWKNGRQLDRAVLYEAFLGPAFALFIVLCGLGHLCDVVVFYWPAYPLFTFLDAATGIVSVVVASSLHAFVSARLRLERARL